MYVRGGVEKKNIFREEAHIPRIIRGSKHVKCAYSAYQLQVGEDWNISRKLKYSTAVTARAVETVEQEDLVGRCAISPTACAVTVAENFIEKSIFS